MRGNATLPSAVSAFVDRMASQTGVRAILLGGSRASGDVDAASDIDLYVCADRDIPIEARVATMRAFDRDAEIDNRWFGPEDAWIDPESGRTIDVVHWRCQEIESRLRDVIEQHRPALGYTTALWFTVRHAVPLFTRDAWFANLQALADTPYPDALRESIVAFNLPLLRSTRASYRHQIALAMERDDAISVNHRIAALLASVTDIVFAVHRTPHSGEKRLGARLAELPGESSASVALRIDALLRRSIAPHGGLIDAVDSLCDAVDELVRDRRT